MPWQNLKKKFLSYVNKDNFDHNMRGIIDPLEFHSTFATLATMYNLMDNGTGSRRVGILLICTIISAVIGGTLFFISFVHYVKIHNIYLITESGMYLIVMIYQLMICYSMIRGKNNYHILLQALRDDFRYIYTNGHIYRQKFFANEKLTFQLCGLMAIFFGGTGLLMAISACIAVLIALNNLEEGSDRPLPYPFWLFDYNLQASPVYEIMFIASMLFTSFFSILYMCFQQGQILWIREITCKADVIVWKLQQLFDDISPAKTRNEKEHYDALIKQRMKEIVERHLDMYNLLEAYAAVHKRILFFEQVVCSPSICMSSYCFVEKMEQGEFQIILILLCVATIGTAFLPSYLCDHLLEKVQSVGDACWDVPFWNAGPVIRPYLVLIIQRAQYRLPLSSPGFRDVNLETFGSMMSKAYSGFNMLRQLDL